MHIKNIGKGNMVSASFVDTRGPLKKTLLNIDGRELLIEVVTIGECQLASTGERCIPSQDGKTSIVNLRSP
jgi:hypothetical protein